MKLYDYILKSMYDEVTVYDEDYDVEVYFYKHDYFEDLDRWDDAMDELAKMLTITSFHSNGAVSVNLSQLIESKMDNLKRDKLFKVYDIDFIMDNIDRIIKKAGSNDGKDYETVLKLNDGKTEFGLGSKIRIS